MADALIGPLLAAVRRALWWEAIARVARTAAWASAALLLGAAAWHLCVGRLALEALAVVAALPWLAALGWGAAQRPGDADCARHADRHLGGASAYGTLLDRRGAPPGPADDHLRRWAAARVPASLLALRARAAPNSWLRPLLVLVVCAALSVFVLTRPGSRAGPSAGSGASSATSAVAIARAPDLAGDLASALRTVPPAEARRTDAATPFARPADATRRNAAEGAAPPAGPSAADAARTASTLQTAAAPTPGGRSLPAAAPGVAAGRDIGDSRDARGPGVSRAATLPTATQWRGVPRGVGSETIADDGRAGRYDTIEGAPGDTAALPAAPALPPTANDRNPLTPAQARYVQAWRHSSR